MAAYPVFLDLKDRLCVVVGGGRTGSAKARTLVDAGASVRVVDPSPACAAHELAAAGASIEIVGRPFEPGDLDGAAIVFACTGDRGVNAAVLAAARDRFVPACDSGTGQRVDAPGLGFASGAVHRRGDVCVAVSTGGASPGLAADIRDRIAAVLAGELAEAAATIDERADVDEGTGRRRIRPTGAGAREDRKDRCTH